MANRMTTPMIPASCSVLVACHSIGCDDAVHERPPETKASGLSYRSPATEAEFGVPPKARHSIRALGPSP